MSTRPDAQAFLNLLTQLDTLSQAFLTCDKPTFDQFEAFVAAREELVQGLLALDAEALTAAEWAVINPAVAALQAMDVQAQERVQALMAGQSGEIAKMVKLRQALGSYRFPSVPQSTGLENQG